MHKKNKLNRKLSFWDGASLIIANVIGIGIFTTPSVVAGMVNSTESFMLVWVIGGGIALIGAMAYSDLSTLIPKAGGEYIYLKKAFGPFWGFLSGWTSFIAGFPGAIAASSIGFAAYLQNTFQYELNSQNVKFAEMLPFSNQELIAITIISILTIAHLLKVNIGKYFQNSLTVVSLITILILIGFGFYNLPVNSHQFELVNLTFPKQGWLLALIPIMFTYSGWNAAVYVAEEIKEPQKNMFRAMFVGTLTVIALYVMLNLVYIRIIPLQTLSENIDVANLLAESILDVHIQQLIGIVILAALISSISAMIMTGPRVYFAMARDKVFPKVMNRIDPKFKTPSGAIIVQSAWSIVLLLTGTFEELLTYTGFAIVLFSSLSVLGLLVIEKQLFSRNPAKFLLYLLFIGFGLLMTLNAIIRSPLPSLGGLFMILAGVPIFVWFNKKR